MTIMFVVSIKLIIKNNNETENTKNIIIAIFTRSRQQ